LFIGAKIDRDSVAQFSARATDRGTDAATSSGHQQHSAHGVSRFAAAFVLCGGQCCVALLHTVTKHNSKSRTREDKMISEKIQRRAVLALAEQMGVGMLAAAAWPWGALAQGQRKSVLVIGWDISDSKYMDPGRVTEMSTYMPLRASYEA